MRWFSLSVSSVFVLFSFLPFHNVIAQGIEVVEGEPVSVLGRDESQQEKRPVTTSRIPAPSSATNSNVENKNEASGSASSTVELFVRMQELQDEVRQLRGLVEQQGYLIEQLGQRRMDDYIDLDRRIGELTGAKTLTGKNDPSASSSLVNQQVNSDRSVIEASGTSSTLKSTTKNVSNTKAQDLHSAAQADNAKNSKVYQTKALAAASASNPVEALSPSDAEEARQSYRSAYQRIKTGDFDVAQVELLAYIDQYPSGADVPVALFWLGELQLQDSSIEKSLDSYGRLVRDFPTHRKVPAAKYKLGKIYQQKGETAKAKRHLQSVVDEHSGSSVAKLAREYLSTLK